MGSCGDCLLWVSPRTGYVVLKGWTDAGIWILNLVYHNILTGWAVVYYTSGLINRKFKKQLYLSLFVFQRRRSIMRTHYPFNILLSHKFFRIHSNAVPIKTYRRRGSKSLSACCMGRSLPFAWCCWFGHFPSIRRPNTSQTINPQTYRIRVQEYNMHDILSQTLSQAIEIFPAHAILGVWVAGILRWHWALNQSDESIRLSSCAVWFIG